MVRRRRSLLHVKRKTLEGISMEYRPRYTKVVSDFDETFSVDRALNLKRFGKKMFFKSCCFAENILKILLTEKYKK